jgi:hypothetical protein
LDGGETIERANVEREAAEDADGDGIASEGDEARPNEEAENETQQEEP